MTGATLDFFFLVPVAVTMGLVGLGAFLWSLRSNQYEDLEGAAERILFESKDGPSIDSRRHDSPRRQRT